MSDKLESAINTLRLICGSHVGAARELGITPEHYRGLRNGRVPIPRRTEELIILKAQAIAPAGSSSRAHA